MGCWALLNLVLTPMLNPKEIFMSVAMLKNALITAATTLAVIYVLNQVGMTRSVVQKALNG
jgi:hypothetical protein